MKIALLAGALALATSAVQAGTLSIDWIGGTQVRTTPEDGENSLYLPPYDAKFSFSVPRLFGPWFDYTADFENTSYYDPLADEGSSSVTDAVLLERPQGHLGGFYWGDYSISVTSNTVSVSGYLADGDDVLVMELNRLLMDHNQGLFAHESFGYWLASYVPNDLADGGPFQVIPKYETEVPAPSAVPLPASALLLGGALAGFGALRRKRS